MKVRTAALAATAAVGAVAQSVSYTTITYEDCPTASIGTMITVTNGVTVTYCPECTNGGSGMTMPTSPGYTTVYTTEYESLCPTGIVTATYTVTESCTDATPTWTAGPNHIPNGFTVTTKDCTVCAATPTAVTITEPCGCEATGGVPVPPTGPPSAPGAPPAGPPAGPPSHPAGPTGSPSPSSPGAPPAAPPAGPPASPPSKCNGPNCPPPAPPGMPAPPCNGTNCGGSGQGMPPAAPSPCNGTNCGGSGSGTQPTPSSPPASASGGMCPGPQCAQPSGPTTPSTGAASSMVNVSFFTSIVLAVTIGALAFAL